MRLFTTPRDDGETLEEFAARLVDESRAGIQSSTATIMNVRYNAKRGNAQAAKTVEAIRQYIASHPVAPKGGP